MAFSRTSPISTILSLPDIDVGSKRTVYKEIFCFGLVLNVMTSGPSRLYVTDFTSNPLVVNQYSKSVFIDEVEVSSNQILQVDMYEEKLDEFFMNYKNVFHEDLIMGSHGSVVRICEKLCLLKTSVILKKYKNVLEARAKKVRLINLDDLANPELQNLLYKVSELPRDFIEDVQLKISTLLPSSFIAEKVQRISSSTVAEQSSQSNGHLEQTPDLSNEHYSSAVGSEFPTTQVKNEDDVLLPDTLFPEDYTNSSPDTHLQNGGDSPESSPIVPVLKEMYSFKDLNDISGNHDNILYPTRGRIVSIYPTDLSQIFVKPYILDSNSRITLGDPYGRDIEIIMCDDVSQEEINPENILSIHVNGKDAIRLFGFESIEQAYIGQMSISQRQINQKPFNLEVFKHEHTLQSGVKYIVWEAKNLEYENIFD